MPRLARESVLKCLQWILLTYEFMSTYEWHLKHLQLHLCTINLELRRSSKSFTTNKCLLTELNSCPLISTLSEFGVSSDLTYIYSYYRNSFSTDTVDGDFSFNKNKIAVFWSAEPTSLAYAVIGKGLELSHWRRLLVFCVYSLWPPDGTSKKNISLYYFLYRFLL